LSAFAKFDFWCNVIPGRIEDANPESIPPGAVVAPWIPGPRQRGASLNDGGRHCEKQKRRSNPDFFVY
jgi:hypothetical protein